MIADDPREASRYLLAAVNLREPRDPWSDNALAGIGL